jgi:prepilin-type N-terminal cleavage/methylation domain-containing protein
MTLIELMVVLMILGLIAAGISTLLASSWQSEADIQGQNEAQKWAQRGADAVVDGLRAASGVQTGLTDSVTATFADGSTVTYYLQSAELRRDHYNASSGQTTTGEVICRNVSGLAFAYYTCVAGSWVPAAAASLAQSLRVSVTIASGKDRATQTSLVKFRNRF